MLLSIFKANSWKPVNLLISRFQELFTAKLFRIAYFFFFDTRRLRIINFVIGAFFNPYICFPPNDFSPWHDFTILLLFLSWNIETFARSTIKKISFWVHKTIFVWLNNYWKIRVFVQDHMQSHVVFPKLG